MGRNGKLATRVRAREVEEEISIGNHDSLRNLKRELIWGFGMIKSGRALWSRAGKSIMPKFFFAFIKTTTSMAVGLFTNTLFMYYYSHMCVCKCSGSEIFERILHMIR